MCVNGTCVDLYQSYACRCNHGYEGRYCDQRKFRRLAVTPPPDGCRLSVDLAAVVSAQTATNCLLENGSCDQECTDGADGLTRTCSCVDGYNLQDDSRTCRPKGETLRARSPRRDDHLWRGRSFAAQTEVDGWRRWSIRCSGRF